MKRAVTLLLVLGAAACKHSYFDDPAISAIQSRAQGGCYSQCSPGWRCDSETGYCEKEPPPEAPAFPMRPSDSAADAGS